MKIRIATVLFLASIYLRGQTSKISVRLLDASSKTPIPLGWVTSYKNGIQGKYAETNFDGVARFKLPVSKATVISVRAMGYLPADTVIKITQDSLGIILHLTVDKPLRYDQIYNRDSAYADIKRGQIKVLFAGLILTKELNRINDCCQKYGFKYTFTTDVIDGDLGDIGAAIKTYNSVVVRYLNLINKPDWLDELKKDCGLDLK